MRVPVDHRLCGYATSVALLLACPLARAQPATLPEPPNDVPITQPSSEPASELQLVADDQALLARGEISDSRWISGGLLSSVIGLGIGQGVQGRWADRGWMFAVGEVAAGGVVVLGLIEGLACDEEDAACSNGTNVAIRAAFFGGLAAYAGIRVWDAIDAFVVPPRQNARIRALRARLGLPSEPGIALAPYIAPVHAVGGDTAVAGLQLSF
jgi:hypothetical protein